MDYMYSGDLAIIDLESGEVDFREFTELDDYGPGFSSCLAVFKEYEESDPVVIGSGLFTGTTVPASCLGFVLAKDSDSDRVFTVPLNLYAGVEVKFSGFSAVAIIGNASSPVYVWLHDGVADVLDASNFASSDTWNTTDLIRSEMGDRLVQVISCGPFDNSHQFPKSASINYWGSLDPGHVAASFFRKNLKAVAIRGLGMIDAADPDAFFSSSLEFLKRCKPENGFALWNEQAAKIDEWVMPLVHRYRSCYGCPMACFPFLKYREQPSVLSSEGVEEPGILLTAYHALKLLKEKGFNPKEAMGVLEACLKMGLEAIALSSVIEPDAIKASENIVETVKTIQKENRIAIAPSAMFANWYSGEENSAFWETLNRAAYTLGICPIFLIKSGIDISEFYRLSGLACQTDFDQESVDASINRLI